MSKNQGDKYPFEFSGPIQKGNDFPDGVVPGNALEICGPFKDDHPGVPSVSAERLMLAVTRAGFHPFIDCFVSGGMVVLNLFEEEVEAFRQSVIECEPTLLSAVNNCGPLDIWRFARWEECFLCENGKRVADSDPVVTNFRSAKIPMEHAAKVTAALEDLSESPGFWH